MGVVDGGGAGWGGVEERSAVLHPHEPLPSRTAAAPTPRFCCSQITGEEISGKTSRPGPAYGTNPAPTGSEGRALLVRVAEDRHGASRLLHAGG